MDIYDYLKMDHDKVDHLFKLFEKSKNECRKKEIIALLSKELLVHAHSEQETFYKVLEHHRNSQDEAFHGVEEHKEIEEQITRMNACSDNDDWEEAVKDLKKLVKHHVKEEEGEIFHEAKKILSERDAVDIKEKMHYLKGKFLLWLEKKELQHLKETVDN